MTSFFIVDTVKDFDGACMALEDAAATHGFTVLTVHDLGEKLRSKAISFPEQCRVFEICNPQQAARVLSSDIALSMVLPCRISVSTEAGTARIGMIPPGDLLSTLSGDPGLQQVGQEVEAEMRAIIIAAADRLPLAGVDLLAVWLDSSREKGFAGAKSMAVGSMAAHACRLGDGTDPGRGLIAGESQTEEGLSGLEEGTSRLTGAGCG